MGSSPRDALPGAQRRGRPVTWRLAFLHLVRPPGKRSDPGWSPRTIMMNKHTHKSVQRILLETESEQDLSELVDELLKAWIDKRP